MNPIQKNGTITIRPRKISRENILLYATISNNYDGGIMRYPTGQSHDTKVFIISPTGIIRIIGVLDSRLEVISNEEGSRIQAAFEDIFSERKKRRFSPMNKFALKESCLVYIPFHSMRL